MNTLYNIFQKRKFSNLFLSKTIDENYSYDNLLFSGNKYCFAKIREELRPISTKYIDENKSLQFIKLKNTTEDIFLSLDKYSHVYKNFKYYNEIKCVLISTILHYQYVTNRSIFILDNDIVIAEIDTTEKLTHFINEGREYSYPMLDEKFKDLTLKELPDNLAWSINISKEETINKSYEDFEIIRPRYNDLKHIKLPYSVDHEKIIEIEKYHIQGFKCKQRFMNSFHIDRIIENDKLWIDIYNKFNISVRDIKFAVEMILYEDIIDLSGINHIVFKKDGIYFLRLEKYCDGVLSIKSKNFMTLLYDMDKFKKSSMSLKEIL